MRSRIRRLAAAGGVALAGAVPGTASATVTVETTSVASQVHVRVISDAASDAVSIARSAGTLTVTITSADNAVENSADCTGDNTKVITCSGAFVQLMAVTGGGGDDQFDVSGAHGFVGSTDLGDGHDRFTVAASATSWHGSVRGGAGDDRIESGPSCLQLLGGTGADTLDGGTGRCATADYSDSGAGVTVTLDGQPNDGAGEGDNVLNVRNVTGSSLNDVLDATGFAPVGDEQVSLSGMGGDDVLRGSGTTDYLSGGENNDTLEGNGGQDNLVGGDGDDQLRGGDGGDDLSDEAGSDRLEGGPGPDDLSAYGTGADGVDVLSGGDDFDSADLYREDADGKELGVNVSLDNVANDGVAGETDDVRSDIESVQTYGGNDVLVGNDGPNVLAAGSGDDTIDARGGVDNLFGGAGTDRLTSRDASGDLVRCGTNAQGAEADVADVDDLDAIFACEAVNLVPIPKPPVPDTTKPSVRILGIPSRGITRRSFARNGVRVRVETNEAARIAGTLVARTVFRSGRLRLAAAGDLAVGSKSLAAGTGRRTLQLKPARAYRSLLRNRTARLVVEVTATDAAGNSTKVRRSIRIRR